MNSRTCRSLFVGLALGSLEVAAACGATFTVRSLSNNTFVPSNLTIHAGDSVRFVNQGSGLHNVIEDGGAFRCAEGCDGQGGDGDPSSADWSFTLTFPTAGTIGYYCDVHGSPGVGMIGKIQVITPGAPGTLDFSAEAYSAGEGSGGAAIVVRRTRGATGAVSVRYAATAGTASPADFTPTSGILSWGDGDLAVKTFSVSIANDALVEGNETLQLSLSNATGGASLARASAVLTLVDDDVVDSPGRLALRAPVVLGIEGSAAQVVVARTEGAAGAVSVAYSTSDGSATAGSDYPATSGTLVFAAGESGEKTISIPLASDDDDPESDAPDRAEDFHIELINPTGGADLFYPSSATVVILPERPAAGPLTGEEVACDAARLFGLLARSAVTAPRSSRATTLALSFSGSGDFAGLAAVGRGGAEGEAALLFSTNPEETTLLKNPARPQLFSVGMTRNELNSDLVVPGAEGELMLSINPTLDPNAPAGNLLAIDNRAVSGGAARPADAKPGRGLAPLIIPCHGGFGAEDVHLFRVLLRVARGEAAGAKALELAIYRAAEPGRYRLDLYPLGADGAASGRLSVEFEVVRSGAGDLIGGTLRRLGLCAAGQTTGCSDLTGLAANAALALWKPVLAGPPPATPYRISASGPGEVAVDLADLLAGTTWRRPLE